MKIIIAKAFNRISKNTLLLMLIILSGIFSAAYFGIKHQMTFFNLDELLWMYRSRFFIDRLLDFNFSNLIQSSQPGIMVMWLVGPFMKIINYDFQIIKTFIENLNNSGIPYNIINDPARKDIYENYKSISYIFNIPIISLLILFIITSFHFLLKLGINKWAVIFSLLLISTTPYYIYFTTPTDKFVGIFSTLSILSLLLYLEKGQGKKYLIFSAIMCSWAVLSKLSALFLVPFSFFVLVYYKYNIFPSREGLGVCKNDRKDNQRTPESPLKRGIHSIVEQSGKGCVPSNSGFIKTKQQNKQIPCSMFHVPCSKNIIKDYILWLSIFFLTSAIFLPAIITDPKSIINFFAKESSERTIANNYDIFLNIKILSAYLSDSFVLSFNLFIIAIFLSFIFLLVYQIRNKMKVDKKYIVFAFYFFGYLAFVTLFSKTYSFRYLVPALIIFQILSGIAIYEFSNILAKKRKIKNINEIYYWDIVFILISQILLIYYSELGRIESLPSF